MFGCVCENMSACLSVWLFVVCVAVWLGSVGSLIAFVCVCLRARTFVCGIFVGVFVCVCVCLCGCLCACVLVFAVVCLFACESGCLFLVFAPVCVYVCPVVCVGGWLFVCLRLCL